jgi:hypothetical protein
VRPFAPAMRSTPQIDDLAAITKMWERRLPNKLNLNGAFMSRSCAARHSRLISL